MIPLKEWAEKHNIPHRTALYRAKSGKYPAKLKQYTVKSEHVALVTGYMIDEEFDPTQS